MISKFVLSDGSTTYSVTKYIVDLFKIYLTVFPGDIPGNSSIGFNFIMSGVKKVDLENEISSRVNALVEKIRQKFTNYDVTISVESCSLVDSKTVNLVLNVNGTLSTLTTGVQ